MHSLNYGHTSMKLTRRTLLATGATLGFTLPALPQTPPPPAEGVTRYVADFVVKTSSADLPPEVIALGKKSILDGIGLALAGSVAETGPLSRDYVKALGPMSGSATVIGSGM